MIPTLLTLTSPPQVGQYLMTWLAQLELRTLIGGGDVPVKGADYKRVLWAYWQEAKQIGEIPPRGTRLVQEGMGSLGNNGPSCHSPVPECHRGSKVERWSLETAVRYG